MEEVYTALASGKATDIGRDRVNVIVLVTVVPLTSVPVATRVCVPYDAGRGMLTPLFEQGVVEDTPSMEN